MESTYRYCFVYRCWASICTHSTVIHCFPCHRPIQYRTLHRCRSQRGLMSVPRACCRWPPSKRMFTAVSVGHQSIIFVCESGANVIMMYIFHLPWEAISTIPSHLISSASTQISLTFTTFLIPNRTPYIPPLHLVYHVLVERPSSSTTPTPTTSTQPSQLRRTFVQLFGHHLS